VGAEVLASPLHFEQEALFPKQIGEPNAFGSMDSVFQSGAGFLVAGMAKGLEEPIAKYLRLALLVTRQTSAVTHEFLEAIDVY
jgi:hypothetical protein